MNQEKGLPKPNYTGIPNTLFEMMPDMKEAELRVVLAIARQTFGWHKKNDRISLRQMQKLTGLSRPAIIRGLAEGEDREVIKRREVKRGDPEKGYYYSLVVKESDHSEETEWETKVTTSGKRKLPPATPEVVNESYQQKKEKETIQKKTTTPPAQTEPQPTTTPLTESVAVAVEQSTRPRDLLFDAITEHWQAAPGQVAILKSVMLGTNRKYPACNFSPPATPDEVGAFVHWYARKYPNINLPVAPEKLQSHFYQFRAAAPAARAETRIHNGMIQKRVGNSWYNERPAPNGAA